MMKVILNGQERELRATAASPFIYRRIFGGDMFLDYEIVRAQINSAITDEKLAYSDIYVPEVAEILEKFAYVMLCKEGENENFVEWLEQFEMFEIYNLFPKVLELWGLSSETKSIVKKKNGQSTGKIQ